MNFKEELIVLSEKREGIEQIKKALRAEADQGRRFLVFENGQYTDETIKWLRSQEFEVFIADQRFEKDFIRVSW